MPSLESGGGSGMGDTMFESDVNFSRRCLVILGEILLAGKRPTLTLISRAETSRLEK